MLTFQTIAIVLLSLAVVGIFIAFLSDRILMQKQLGVILTNQAKNYELLQAINAGDVDIPHVDVKPTYGYRSRRHLLGVLRSLFIKNTNAYIHFDERVNVVNDFVLGKPDLVLYGWGTLNNISDNIIDFMEKMDTNCYSKSNLLRLLTMSPFIPIRIPYVLENKDLIVIVSWDTNDIHYYSFELIDTEDNVLADYPFLLTINSDYNNELSDILIDLLDTKHIAKTFDEDFAKVWDNGYIAEFAVYLLLVNSLYEYEEIETFKFIHSTDNDSEDLVLEIPDGIDVKRVRDKLVSIHNHRIDVHTDTDKEFIFKLSLLYQTSIGDSESDSDTSLIVKIYDSGYIMVTKSLKIKH